MVLKDVIKILGEMALSIKLRSSHRLSKLGWSYLDSNATKCMVRFIRLSRSSSNKKNILRLRDERMGFIQDVFPLGSASSLAEFLKNGNQTMYAGFDPTADSLHIGNLLVIMAMLQSQRAGHKVIALIGGATAKIGDPSGKTSERPSLDDETLDSNIVGITECLERIFSNHQQLVSATNGSEFSDMTPIEIVNNNSWYKDINIIDFLRTAGRKFRMGKMLSRDSVQARLSAGDTTDGGRPDPDGGLSFTEFTYQVFQAYDWFHLRHRYNCTIQLGGSDQMGNIATGHEFITKFDNSPDRFILLKNSSEKFDGDTNNNDKLPAYGILLPLVTSESGEKIGKSQDGQKRIWLTASKTSPFEFYQYFLRLPDSQIEKMLYYYTLLPPTEIKDLMDRHQRQSEKRYPHTKLAELLTQLVHGPEGLNLATKATKILYGSNELSEAEWIKQLSNLNESEMLAIFSQARYTRMLFTPGISIMEFALKIGCFSREKDAQRIISAGGFSINQVKRTNIEELLINGVHVLPNNLTLVRVGKKNYFIVEWTMY